MRNSKPQKCTTTNTNIVGFIMPSNPTKTGEESMKVYKVGPLRDKHVNRRKIG